MQQLNELAVRLQLLIVMVGEGAAAGPPGDWGRVHKEARSRRRGSTRKGRDGRVKETG